MVKVTRINNVRVQTNFHLYEFESPDTREVTVDNELIERLQMMRDALGAPLIVTSGYRTPEQNVKVGGARFSQHLRGKAADVRCPSVSVQTLHALADRVFRLGGVGLYATHVHVDTRGEQARWGGDADGD